MSLFFRLQNVKCFNPLLPETFFPPNFEILPKRGFHRLLTHRRMAANRNYLYDSFFFKNEILIVR